MEPTREVQEIKTELIIKPVKNGFRVVRYGHSVFSAGYDETDEWVFQDATSMAKFIGDFYKTPANRQQLNG